MHDSGARDNKSRPLWLEKGWYTGVIISVIKQTNQAGREGIVRKNEHKSTTNRDKLAQREGNTLTEDTWRGKRKKNRGGTVTAREKRET